MRWWSQSPSASSSVSPVGLLVVPICTVSFAALEVTFEMWGM